MVCLGLFSIRQKKTILNSYKSNISVAIVLLGQILAGNARKVGSVRFERIENDAATVETKEVTRLVPKIMKRKWSTDHDSDDTEYDEDSFQKKPQNTISDEHEDNVDNLSRH